MLWFIFMGVLQYQNFLEFFNYNPISVYLALKHIMCWLFFLDSFALFLNIVDLIVGI